MPRKARRFVRCQHCGKKVSSQGLFGHHKGAHPDLPYPGLPPRGLEDEPAPIPIIEHEEAIPEEFLEPEPVRETQEVKSAPAKQNPSFPSVRRMPRSIIPSSGIAPGAMAIVSPRSFMYQTDLLWAGMKITQQEWGWPVMDPSTWMDTFLFIAFKDYGYTIAGYTRNEDGLELIPGEDPPEPPPPPFGLTEEELADLPPYDDDSEEPAVPEGELEHASA